MRTKCPARSISDFRYSPLAAALTLAFGTGEAAAGNNFQVNVQGDRFPSTAPTTPGTLRAAIEFFNVPANCTGSGDTITFFSNGPFTVNVSDPLPIVNCGSLTINGDLGTFGKALLNQSGGGPMNGLEALTSSPVTVENMQVTNFSYGTAALRGNLNALGNALTRNTTGIDTDTYSGVPGSPLSIANNTLTSNVIGIRLNRNFGKRNYNDVSVTGNTVTSNQTGIYVYYGGSTVVVDGNTVTGNVVPITAAGNGIFLHWSKATVNNNLVSSNDRGIYLKRDLGSQITTNRIGSTNPGTGPMGNATGIVSTGDTSLGSSTLPSSGTEISGNVISANAGYAIELNDFQNVKITGNKIGTTLDGTGALANNFGIIAYCGTGIEVSNNVISGNQGNGVEFGGLQGGGALNIVDNKIGVQGDGVTSLGNNAYGVVLYSGSCGTPTPVSSGVTDLLVRGNVIAYNTADGFLISGTNPPSTGNKIVANKMFANGAKNLNLGTPGGPRPNDAGDADTGPNNGQNYPVISSLARDWPNTRTAVNFLLDTAPGIYRIDMYSNRFSNTPGSTVHYGFQRFDAGTGPTAGTVYINGLTVGSEPNIISLTATGPFSSDADFDLDSVRRDTSEYSPTAFLSPTVAVTVTPNPPNLDFGQVPINTTSPAQTITLLSSGNEPYRILNMGQGVCTTPISGGAFIISNGCIPNRDYLPGESCQLTARFAPLTIGSQSLVISDCDNTFLYGGSRNFSLVGTGIEPPPIAINPPEWDFGSVLAGKVSPTTTFAISNPGPSTIAIGPVTISGGEFSIDSTTCGSSITSGNLCTADVTFRPIQPVRSNGTLSVSAGSAPAAVKISRVSSAGTASAFVTGQGIQEADIQLPSAIDFGTYTVGTPAIRRTVEITNTGNAVVSFSNISVTGPFVLTNGCPLNIAPGEHCTLTLDFSVPNVDSFTGVLAVVSNAVGGTRSIPLTARSVALPLAQLSVSPNTISFGDRLLGTTSTTQRVTVRNIGNIPVTVASITTSPDYVVSGNTCTLPLAPTSTCFADVALRPAGFGPRAGSLFVNSNAVGSPNVVGLSGTGCRPFSSSASRFGMGSGFNCAP